jgi:hypothetical protein
MRDGSQARTSPANTSVIKPSSMTLVAVINDNRRISSSAMPAEHPTPNT